MTVYRGTLCGRRGCQSVATHFLRLLVPRHGAPYDRRVPMDLLVSAEVCAAHADKAAFAAELKAAGVVDQVQNFCRAGAIAPVDIGRAVVRLVSKDDGDFFQYPSR
jgi:hypothetical protein